MVKITQEVDIEGNYKYLLEIDFVDLIKAKPSQFAKTCKELYKKTGKISDLLMWLSEEVVAIEESEEGRIEKEIKV